MYRIHYWSFGAPYCQDYETLAEAEAQGYALTDDSGDHPYGLGFPWAISQDGEVLRRWTFSEWRSPTPQDQSTMQSVDWGDPDGSS